MAFDLSRVLATQSHYICIIIVPIQPLSMLKKMLYNYTNLKSWDNNNSEAWDNGWEELNVVMLMEPNQMYYICLENAVKSCPTLCFPDEMELLRGWTKKFLWVANLRMHAPEDRGYVPMFLTVPFLMMGVVEAKEVLEVVVM